MAVTISIKSEIDSRVLLYPLMRCLKPLGNILVVTSNRQVSRLIDGEFDGDFRNFRILVDVEGGTDELLEDAGISPDEYTFVVYDNVGVVEQDKLLIPIGPIVSENFESEMLYLGEDRNTHILRFGRPVKNVNSKTSKEKGTDKKSLQHKEMSEEDIDEVVKTKFRPKKIDVSDKLKKLPNLNFPRFEDIEFLESNKQFFTIDNNIIKFFYAVFQEYIGIKEPYFVREVTRKDASSSSIGKREASGENSIELVAR